MGVDINWSALGGFPNAGEAFQKGLEHGREQRKVALTENALRAYAANPNDPRSLNALAVAEPRLAIQAQGLQFTRQEALRKQQEETAKAHLEVIGNAAKEARDPQSWDKIAQHLAENGYPEAANYIGKFDPTLRATMMARAGVKDDAPDYTVIDGVAIDNRTGQPVFESPYPRIVSGPGGIYEQPRVGFGRGGAGPPPAGHVIDIPDGQLPPGFKFDDEGGPSPTGSATFP